MGAGERKQAFVENHPYRKAVEGGYPHLIAAGAELVRQGVRFHDLTAMFSNTTEPIYADTCCHVNEQGNEMLATRIAETIVDAFGKRSHSGN